MFTSLVLVDYLIYICHYSWLAGAVNLRKCKIVSVYDVHRAQFIKLIILYIILCQTQGTTTCLKSILSFIYNVLFSSHILFTQRTLPSQLSYGSNKVVVKMTVYTMSFQLLSTTKTLRNKLVC